MKVTYANLTKASLRAIEKAPANRAPTIRLLMKGPYRFGQNKVKMTKSQFAPVGNVVGEDGEGTIVRFFAKRILAYCVLMRG